MAAICDACGWIGTSSQVVNGGRCPLCKEPVRYGTAGGAPLLIAINHPSEFNRRAAIALRGVTFPPHCGTANVVASFRVQFERDAVSPKMQQAVYNIVHRFRRQISDTMLKEYAALHAKGAD